MLWLLSAFYRRNYKGLLMNITNSASAGTLESSDIQIRISPSLEQSLDIVLNSTVQKQFGDAIEQLIRTVCSQMGVTSALVEAEDKGALDCVIKARLQAAIMRASEGSAIKWELIK